MRNFVRRLNRRCRRHGKPKAKWITVTEHQEEDPAGGVREVRYHHHMILQCELSLDEIKDAWCTGQGVWKERLGLAKADRAEFEHGTLEAFCQYITKYPKRKRRWRQSQGLKKPEYRPPNDTRHSARKLDEIARGRIDDKTFWEKQYGKLRTNAGVREYEFVEAEARYNQVDGSWHVIAKMWADPRRQRRKRRSGDQT